MEMTAVGHTRGAGATPADFGTYGDYTSPVLAALVAAAANGDGGALPPPEYPFRARISADGASGFPAEPGRYHLYISWACPFAQRSAIVRRLKGLDDVVSLSALDPVRDGRGWAFRDGPGHSLDPVNGFALLREAYEATAPGYRGHVSVPVLWDRETGRIVNNAVADITIDLDTQFEAWAGGAHQLYPEALRPEIDAVNAVVYENVNYGVYLCGFAPTQRFYDEMVARVFRTLDELEERLAHRRYLVGEQITEADVRLWVSLARFDAVYHPLFKVSLRRLTDYPSLWRYTRDLYSVPAFRETTDFDHINRHYFSTFSQLNPSRIVPVNPAIGWE